MKKSEFYKILWRTVDEWAKKNCETCKNALKNFTIFEKDNKIKIKTSEVLRGDHFETRVYSIKLEDGEVVWVHEDAGRVHWTWEVLVKLKKAGVEVEERWE